MTDLDAVTLYIYSSNCTWLSQLTPILLKGINSGQFIFDQRKTKFGTRNETSILRTTHIRYRYIFGCHILCIIGRHIGVGYTEQEDWTIFITIDSFLFQLDNTWNACLSCRFYDVYTGDQVSLAPLSAYFFSIMTSRCQNTCFFSLPCHFSPFSEFWRALSIT